MNPRTAPLRRELGLFGAVVTGLGAMVGTGVFVSLGLAAGITGPAVIFAIALAAGIAACNGLSSAQLAANHPVSGGTYEYGYRYLQPWIGFTAGWLFVLAKSASAATAALGFAGYLLYWLNASLVWQIPLSLMAVLATILIATGGISRSRNANAAIVAVTIGTLLYLVVGALPALRVEYFTPWFVANTAASTERLPLAALLEATAFMFVAYTGYGRIATLGEEIHAPRRTIPRAVICTIAVTTALYLAVAIAGIGVMGSDGLAEATRTQASPLAAAADALGLPGGAEVLATGAIIAMLGVLLNLMLGVSRVLLAMGRRGDATPALSQLNAHGTPGRAVWTTGAIVAGLVLVGDVKITWAFSAFTVLVYYAITNLAALRLSAPERLYPRAVPLCGLAGCLLLAFWVPTVVWMSGLGLVGAGLLSRHVFRRRR